MNITSEDFERDFVKIVMEWATSDRPVSYIVNIIPHEQVDINLNETSVLELAIPYNKLFRMSIKAVLCNEKNRATSTLLLFYYGETECVWYK